MYTFSLSVNYAFRTLGHLEGPQGRWIRVEALSEMADAPGPFLGKVLQALQKAGLVASLRGRNGGFRLAREAGDLPLGAVVDALDGRGWRTSCILGMDACSGRTDCAAWTCCREMREKMVAELGRLTVADLGRIHGGPRP